MAVDLTKEQIYDIVGSNTNSNFVYIKYTYPQLGKSEEWFRNICIIPLLYAIVNKENKKIMWKLCVTKNNCLSNANSNY